MEVFWISGSAPAWRTLLCLEAKGLAYQSRVLETSNKEHKASWFLKINHRGQVPVLRDGEIVITESLAIMHYLEKKQPVPPLFGTTPGASAKIEQGVQEILSYTDPAVSRFVQPAFRNRMGQYTSEFPQIAEDIHKELALLESKIEKGPWITGTYSAADIVLIPTYQRLLRAIDKEPEAATQLGLENLTVQYPRLTSWNREVQSLASFSATYPPHWRDS